MGFIIYAIIATIVIYCLSLKFKEVSFEFWIIGFGCMLFTFVILPAFFVYKDYKKRKTLEIIDDDLEKEGNKESEKTELENKTIENKLKRLKEKKEKLDYWKNYFLYDKYFYIILINISKLPFHYSSSFESSVSNKFEIVQLLLKSMAEKLPKEYNLNDIKELTTYRKSAHIISEALQPHFKEKLFLERFYETLVELENYSSKPNNNILDDVEHDTALLNITTFCNFQIAINARINGYIDLIQNLEKTKIDFQNKANLPKYDFEKCTKSAEEFDNEINFYILYIYYDIAISIIYYIYVNRIIDKIINESELYKLYESLKKEVHNNNYIIEKLFPIYSSLYEKDFELKINTEEEFQYVIETIDRKRNDNDNGNFININESILNCNIDSLINEASDEKTINKIIESISEKFMIYREYVTFDDVFKTYIYENKFLQILDNVKEQRAIREKDRILNGNFEAEKLINDDELDYTKINNGYEFENFVANLYKRLSYNIINITSKSGDQGADVIVEKDNIKYAIQVKYYSYPVGNKAIQEIVAAKNYYKTDKAMVITNSTFTPQAITLANANDVLLIDKESLDKLIEQARIIK